MRVRLKRTERTRRANLIINPIFSNLEREAKVRKTTPQTENRHTETARHPDTDTQTDRQTDGLT
jgi:hypothetical protein